MSKVEGGGGGGPIDPPSRLRVTIFSRRLLVLISNPCSIISVVVLVVRPFSIEHLKT